MPLPVTELAGRPSSHRRSTIEDVAVAAGVSVATVSRALRGLPNVATSTRERVSAFAAQLGYRADPAASRLAMGRSRSIAVAVPLLNGWYFAQVISGAEAVCAERGYDMIVIGVSDHAARLSLVDSTTSIDRRVDGVIFVYVPLSETNIASLDDRGLQVVTVGQSTDRFASVGIDDVAVGDMATSYLLELGHTRIALIGDQPVNPLGFVVGALRHTGYVRALRRAGITPDPTLQAPSVFTLDGGKHAMTSLLGLEHPPTGVFAMSDEMAFGAMLALKEVGRSAPRDISLIGVDDHDVSAVVGLSTVRQSVIDHGARAARILIDQVEGRPTPAERHDGKIELIRRESCAKA